MRSFHPLLTDYLGDIAAALPLWMVYIGGIIFVAKRYRAHRRPSLLAMLALVILILTALVAPLAGRLVIHRQIRGGWNDSQTETMLSVVGFVGYTFTAAALALLLFAVYSARSPLSMRRAERVRDQDFPFDRPKRYPDDILPATEAPDTSIRERKE